MSSDKDWEQWGSKAPYYGVITDDRFKDMTPDKLEEFYNSGEDHVSKILQRVGKPSRALDFGCGTGRIAIPLSKRCEVVGVDVSPSMLAEAQRNSTGNATFVLSDDELSRVEGKFDLVHSVIVFQHIPVARGMRITEKLLTLLNHDGYAALHYPFSRDASVVRKAINWVRHNIPGAHPVINFLQGRPAFDPPMQMNCYDLGDLFVLFIKQGMEITFVENIVNAGYFTATIYARKTR